MLPWAWLLLFGSLAIVLALIGSATDGSFKSDQEWAKYLFTMRRDEET